MPGERLGSCFLHPFFNGVFAAFFDGAMFVPQGIWERRRHSNAVDYDNFGEAKNNSLTRLDIERFMGFAAQPGADRCYNGCATEHFNSAQKRYIDKNAAQLEIEARITNVSLAAAATTRARRALHRSFDVATDKTLQRQAVGFDGPGCHVALHRRVGDTVGTDRCLTDAIVLGAVKRSLDSIRRVPSGRLMRCNRTAGLTLHVFSDNLWVPDLAASKAKKPGNYDEKLYARAMHHVKAIEHEPLGVVGTMPDPASTLALVPAGPAGRAFGGPARANLGSRTARPLPGPGPVQSSFHFPNSFPVGRFHQLTFGYLNEWVSRQGLAFVHHSDADLLTAVYGLTHADAVITAPSLMSVRLKVLANADLDGGFGFFDWCGDAVSFADAGDTTYDVARKRCLAPPVLASHSRRQPAQKHALKRPTSAKHSGVRHWLAEHMFWG